MSTAPLPVTLRASLQGLTAMSWGGEARISLNLLGPHRW